LDYAASIKDLNISVFKSCLDNEMSLGLVLRDINLAESNQITGTPTIFINGRRIDGVRTAAELTALIDGAKHVHNEAAAATSRSSVISAAERGPR
jgi:protein-disulfide isomerase